MACASLFVLLLAAPACGGVSADAGTGGEVSSEQFASDLADAFCDNVGDCCGDAAIAFDLASCKVNAHAFFQGQLGQILKLKVSYVASAANKCVAAYASVAKSCASLDSSSVINAGCRPVFVGTLPVGARCTDSSECAAVAGNSVACNGAASASCAATAKLTLGASCSDTCPTRADCSSSTTSAGASTPGFCYEDDGLYCSSSNTCQSLLQVGDPCNDVSYCTAGALCTAGVCTAISSCADDSDCPGGFCQVGPDGTKACGANGISSANNCAGAIGAGAD